MIRKSYLAVSALTAVLFFSGCSHKEVFKPEQVKGTVKPTRVLSSSIANVNGNGAILENNHILSKQGETHFALAKNENFINTAGDWIITETSDGNLKLTSATKQKESVTLELKRKVATVNVDKDIVAVLFANNEMALYSLSSKKLLFKESTSPAVAVDSRIVQPYFLNDLVLFLTLDGKIVIVNSSSNQVIRTTVVSSGDYFNNPIFFDVINNQLIASSANGILALSQKEVREKYDIRDVVYEKEGIWIATKQGEIIALSKNLEFIAKQKFPFAHFVGLIVSNDRLYALEKQGYLVVLPKNLASFDIYNVSLDKDDRVLVGQNGFYFDDKILPVDTK